MTIDRADTLYSGWSTSRRVHFRLPDGTALSREGETHGEAAVVLPYAPDRRTALLVRQPRASVILAGEAPLLAAPAGGLASADPAEGARREAMEECGVRLGALEPVGAFWSMPAVSTERLHLFLARYGVSDRVGDGGGLAEEDENIEVLEASLDALFDQERRGAIPDLKTAYLLAVLRERLGARR